VSLAGCVYRHLFSISCSSDQSSPCVAVLANLGCFAKAKSNFEGHNKLSTNNMHAYASAYGEHCLMGLLQPAARYADAYSNNTCILGTAGDSYLELSRAVGHVNVTDASSVHLILGSNTIFAPNANVSVVFGTGIDAPFGGMQTIRNITSWLALGLDPGTTVLDSRSLTSADIIEMGFTVLRGG
jgi:hypothetical protein